MGTQKTLVLVFVADHSTERAVLFQELPHDLPMNDKGPVVGGLYMKKEALELIGNPDEIRVTVEPRGGE